MEERVHERKKAEGVGARHYAELIMLAEEQYPRYAEYLKTLREKVEENP